MEVKEFMITAVNKSLKLNKSFEEKYAEEMKFSFVFDKCTYLAKTNKINKPQYGGNFICVARYNKEHKSFLWEHSNPYTTDLSRKKASLLKKFYEKNTEYKWLNTAGMNGIDFKTAQCLASCALIILGGIYLVIVQENKNISFIVLKDIDAVKDEKQYGR